MRPVAIVAVVLLAAGCSSSNQKPRTEVAEGLAALEQVSSCADLEGDLRRSALAQMNEQLDSALALALENVGLCPAYDSTADGGVGTGTGGVAPGATSNADGSAGNGAERASSYSTTNTQVAGVDEADILKNDDRYFYLLAKGELQILLVWPPEQAQVLSHTRIEGRPLKLFVQSGRAVVYSSLEPEVQPVSVQYPYGDGGEPCTYGYTCDFTGDGRPAKVTVFDLTDLAHPVVLREIRFSGTFINARRIGDAVFTVIAAPDVTFPGLSYWPDGISPCSGADPEEIRAAFEALRAKNAEIIETAPLTDWLPSASDTVWVDGQAQTRTGLLGDCRGFFTSQIDDGRSFLTLGGFDLTRSDAMSLATIVGRPGAVYANGEALYVASRHEQPTGGRWFYEAETVPEATTVHRFQLSPEARTSYTGSGVVKGRVLNQFSMDEHEGKLRIATTMGHVRASQLASPEVHSTVSVLQQGSGGLDLVGELNGIAPGEDIRAARFHGPRGFLVTFKKTDPLFVLDLSDAALPRVLGELEIPGFSTYLHMMDDAHLLSIGFDAEDEGSFAWFAGVQLQIFDVSDPASPARTHRELIGTRGTSSQALTDHLAFNYFAARDLLAIPMVVCEGGSGGSFGDRPTFTGLMVYRVTAADGFEYLGGISHPESVTSCSSWWSSPSSPVKRSVIMDDFVFSISEDEVKADALGALGTDVAVVPLVAAP
jgi:hypothetical protein